MDSIWEEIENCIGQLKLSQLLHEADSNNREVWFVHITWHRYICAVSWLKNCY